MNRLASLLLLCALPAAAQQYKLSFDTLKKCTDAVAAVLGPTGGTMQCRTESIRTITVPATGVMIPANCDGVTDNIGAIRTAIAEAKLKALPAILPAGTCAYSDTITLDGVRLIGKGDASVLFSLNVSKAAIFLRGSGAEVRSLKLAGVTPTTRAAPYENSRVVAVGASQWVVDNVTITSSAAAGIVSTRASIDGRITNNRVSGTLADGIHLTDKSSYITVSGNRLDGTGDDGIAVVSYQEQINPVHHITAVGNAVANNKGGRSMSVVGGSDVLYENNRLSNSGVGACMYLVQEDAYKTQAIRNVVVKHNSMQNCGSMTIGHAAVMLFTNSLTNDAVTIQRNDIVQGPTQVGIRVFGQNTGVSIDSNRISGATTPLRLPAEITVVPYASGSVGAR